LWTNGDGFDFVESIFPYQRGFELVCSPKLRASVIEDNYIITRINEFAKLVERVDSELNGSVQFCCLVSKLLVDGKMLGIG
jgi:hypothetical protein